MSRAPCSVGRAAFDGVLDHTEAVGEEQDVWVVVALEVGDLETSGSRKSRARTGSRADLVEGIDAASTVAVEHYAGAGVTERVVEGHQVDLAVAVDVRWLDPTLIDRRVVRWVMAGYAPVACAISGHLLLRMPGRTPPGHEPAA
jgi:hypothetical protein